MMTDKEISEGFRKVTKTLSQLESDAQKNPFAGSFRDGILQALEDLGLMSTYNDYMKRRR